MQVAVNSLFQCIFILLTVHVRRQLDLVAQWKYATKIVIISHGLNGLTVPMNVMVVPGNEQEVLFLPLVREQLVIQIVWRRLNIVTPNNAVVRIFLYKFILISKYIYMKGFANILLFEFLICHFGVFVLMQTSVSGPLGLNGLLAV